MNDLITRIKTKKWIIFISLFLVFIILDGILAYIYYYCGGDIYHLTLYESMYILLIKYLVLIIAFFLLYRKYLKEKWLDFKKNIKDYFEISFRNWLVGFVIMVVSNLIINYFISGLGENESSVQTIIKEMPVIALFITTILAPFIEEMIFRKSLQDCFHNKTIYMIMSGLLFGLVHVLTSSNIYEYLLIIPYGAIGCMFAKTISETDNIYSTILLHMLHNGVLTILAIGVF